MANKAQTNPEVKPEAEAQVKAQTKAEVKAEVKTEVKAEVKTEVKAEVKPKAKPKVKPEAKAKPQAKAGGYIPSLKTRYKEEIVDKLKKEFEYKSVMQVPKLVKITLNQGMGMATGDKKLVDAAREELTLITGQKAVATLSKKDISNFKLRKGMPIGTMVTLRSAKMYEFLERLIAVSLPRIRDFRGINEKFDGQGNYTLGIKEQIIFPEIDIDKIAKILGVEITFVTSANSDKEAYALLREFGLPFKNKKQQE